MSTSALFLDRDGVINRQIVDGYVTKTDEFEFLPGVLSALAKLGELFDRIFIITNQQGIGKGIFSEQDLIDIHQYMSKTICQNGGRIDKIYHCSALANDNSPFRKPNIGMGKQAMEEFPDIDIKLSVMVGDTLSDMKFGKNIGVKDNISYQWKVYGRINKNLC
ncbi:MAG: HAD family hydrolase [Paludibacteraceae bacterium]